MDAHSYRTYTALRFLLLAAIGCKPSDDSLHRALHSALRLTERALGEGQKEAPRRAIEKVTR